MERETKKQRELQREAEVPARISKHQAPVTSHSPRRARPRQDPDLPRVGCGLGSGVGGIGGIGRNQRRGDLRSKPGGRRTGRAKRSTRWPQRPSRRAPRPAVLLVRHCERKKWATEVVLCASKDVSLCTPRHTNLCVSPSRAHLVARGGLFCSAAQGCCPSRPRALGTQPQSFLGPGLGIARTPTWQVPWQSAELDRCVRMVCFSVRADRPPLTPPRRARARAALLPAWGLERPC